jgi:hypothetical protein
MGCKAWVEDCCGRLVEDAGIIYENNNFGTRQRKEYPEVFYEIGPAPFRSRQRAFSKAYTKADSHYEKNCFLPWERVNKLKSVKVQAFSKLKKDLEAIAHGDKG